MSFSSITGSNCRGQNSELNSAATSSNFPVTVYGALRRWRSGNFCHLQRASSPAVMGLPGSGSTVITVMLTLLAPGWCAHCHCQAHGRPGLRVKPEPLPSPTFTVTGVGPNAARAAGQQRARGELGACLSPNRLGIHGQHTRSIMRGRGLARAPVPSLRKTNARAGPAARSQPTACGQRPRNSVPSSAGGTDLDGPGGPALQLDEICHKPHRQLAMIPRAQTAG